MPFGSARERRSRTTYRPTVTPEGSTHVDTAFTGTTPSFSCTVPGKVAVAVVVRQGVFAEAAGPEAIESGTGFEPWIRVCDREVMATLRFGALFPTANADVEDFRRLLGRVSPRAGLEVVELRWPPGVAEDLADMSDDRLTEAAAGLGDPALLATALDGSVGRFEAVALAVTSASFLRSAHDHGRQLATLARVARCRATTTLRGFQDAVRHLGVTRVGVASVYPSHFTDEFIAHLGETDAAVVHRVDANARTDHDLARWGDERIIDLVARAVHPEAEVVLLPETALHTDHLTAALAEAAGVPVLTATQVTIWSLCRALGCAPAAAGAGPLFGAAAGDA